LKFLLDENANAGSLSTLRTFFSMHTFDHVTEVGWGAIDDLVLFAEMERAGYQALITRDKNQLTDPAERRGLHSHGLYWFGVKDPQTPGLLGLAIETSALLAGLPHVLADLPAEPTGFQLKKVPGERTQRVKNIDLSA
jgi:hypothetical protein